MTTARRELTEAEVATLCNALRVAADKFRENIRILRDIPRPGYGPLADEFDHQIIDSLILADLLESAGYIEIGPEAE